jgi:hypothetical protein
MAAKTKDRTIKYTELIHRYAQGGWQYSAKKVTVKYRDSEGNVCAIYEQCVRDNNRLLKSSHTKTRELISDLGYAQAQEWVDVCHRRDVISIHKGKH